LIVTLKILKALFFGTTFGLQFVAVDHNPLPTHETSRVAAFATDSEAITAKAANPHPTHCPPLVPITLLLS